MAKNRSGYATRIDGTSAAKNATKNTATGPRPQSTGTSTSHAVYTMASCSIVRCWPPTMLQDHTSWRIPEGSPVQSSLPERSDNLGPNFPLAILPVSLGPVRGSDLERDGRAAPDGLLFGCARSQRQSRP